MSAVFSHSMPLFPDDAQFNPTRPIETISIATTSFHNLVNSSNLSSPMIEILEEVISLTYEILRLRGMRATPEEMKSATSRRARVERAVHIAVQYFHVRGRYPTFYSLSGTYLCVLCIPQNAERVSYIIGFYPAVAA